MEQRYSLGKCSDLRLSACEMFLLVFIAAAGMDERWMHHVM